ncbi:MAG: zinc ribbon domain-containing protein [Kiritimatiellia bacterium]|nr:zinc ribbon domain-containing protein [Kiritimatiellia bacterium]
MPLFEYRCQTCGKDFEALLRSGPETAACPSCGGQKVVKQLSVFSPSVKASGAPPCAGGACSAGGCASGACPFSAS